jgi:hypothetical protein
MRSEYRCYIEALGGVGRMQRSGWLLTNRLCPKMALFLLLLTIIVLSVPSSVSALLQQDVYVLVAYDEEWDFIAHWSYFYTPETLAHIIIEEVSWRYSALFSIKIMIAGYTSWDSYNYPNSPDEMLSEAVTETGFVSGTTTMNGHHCEILIAFTNQEIPNALGCCNDTLGAVIVQEVTTELVQHTDNILQHEFSHLYGCGHHYEDDFDCVMNIKRIFLPWPDLQWIAYGATTENWCNSCTETIMSNRLLWGYTCGGGGGGGGRYCTIP